MTFTAWLDTFLAEKGIADQMLEIPGPSGVNIMPLSVVLDAIRSTTAKEQAAIKTMIVRLDFANAPIVPYFAHLAKAIAI